MEYADYHHMTHQLNSNQLTQLHPHQIPMLSAAGLNLTVSSANQVMSCGVNNTNNSGQIVQAGNTGQVTTMYQNVQTVNAANLQPGTQMIVHHINHGHGSSKKKKPKVNKDGVPAPKRATTAYINFTQWYREELKKAGRTIPKIGEFGKECASKWNGMTEEEKTPFLDHAAKDRERYRKEMAIYKPARDANKPKRPGTAFMLFMGDFRKEMHGKEPEGGVAALAKLGGERWRGMTEDDKRPYVEKQNEEKVRYEVSMEDYRRKTAGMTSNQSMTSGDITSPKQARLSTEGSDAGSPDNSDSGGGQSGEQMMSNDQDPQAQNMVVRRQQSESSPSPGTSCSSPQAQTMSPSPIQQQTSQQQNQQTQSISNNSNNNNMSSLPPLSTTMSLSHAITNHTTALMAGYPQHTFTAANFSHPNAAGVLAAGAAAAAAANYNHSGNMSSSSPSYGGGNYTNQSHLPGHYTWN